MALLSLLFCSQEIQVTRASHSRIPIFSSKGSIPISPPTRLPAEVCHDPSAHFLKSGWCWQVPSGGQCGSGWRWVGAHSSSCFWLWASPTGFRISTKLQWGFVCNSGSLEEDVFSSCRVIHKVSYQSKQHAHMHTHTGGTSSSQGQCGLIHVEEEKHFPHWDKSVQLAPHGEGGLPRSELCCHLCSPARSVPSTSTGG